MNLLVTNTRNTHAYHIIRALRPYAQRIVATMEGDNFLGARLSHAANSRLVDKRYQTPFPVEDWRAGRIQRANTEKEEMYIQAVLEICKREKIDTIFPSFDPHVYVFSKNKERFEKLGVLIPIPGYDTVITPLDKYRTIQTAQEVGFPCPRTCLPQSQADLRRIAGEWGFPLVIKPRFTSGGRGTSIVSDFGELSKSMPVVLDGPPMIQEYIPGKEKQQFYLLLDRDGRLKMAFCPKTHRLFDRLYRNSSAMSESSLPHTSSARAASVAEKLGWWGGITMQTKIDPRDGLPKLLEMNPRLGHHLWYVTSLGINTPLMCLKIARREKVEPIEHYPVGKMFLSPVEDLLGFGCCVLDTLTYTMRTRLMRRDSLDTLAAPLPIKETLRSYGRTYFNGKEKIFDPYFTYFLQDPGVSILWWLKFSWQVLAATKHLGR